MVNLTQRGHKMEYEWEIKDGEFVRAVSDFRSWVTADGSQGATGDSGYKAELNRYHLYVSYACPWAHRTIIYRKLKGLEDAISVSVVNPVMPKESWIFGGYSQATKDHIHGSVYLYENYLKANPLFQGLVTVPVLWDKQKNTIVNNESSEIIRMFNTAFNELTNNTIDFYPEALRAKIDSMNELIYENINNGVYRCGFATTQEAYNKAYHRLFDTLQQLEDILSKQRYLVGDEISEADWRLFPTLVRFDAVYYTHFKTNKKRLIDYPNLWGYTKELYQMEGIAETVNMDHIKAHYFISHKNINPTGIVPNGPDIDFTQAHQRDCIT